MVATTNNGTDCGMLYPKLYPLFRLGNKLTLNLELVSESKTGGSSSAEHSKQLKMFYRKQQWKNAVKEC